MGLRFLFTLLCFSPFFGKAQSEDITFRVNGFADTYHAMRSQSPNDWMSSRSRVRTEVNVDKGNANLFVSLNAVQNSIMDNKTGFFLREAFFRYSIDQWELKAGRQIVTWGVADGIRITDLVSPMDYTEFLAQDYDDIRIPENGFRLKYIQSRFNIEGVFIPVADFFQLPVDEENPWSVLSSITMPFTLNMDNTPEKKLSNSEFGARLSVFLSGVDFSVSALHTWNKMPVINKSLSVSMDSIYLNAHYGRMDMLGCDLSVPIKKFVFRAEAAIYLDELQELDMPVPKNTTLAKNSYNGLIGIDWYPGNDWTLMMQYLHKYITGYEDRIAARQNTGLATLNISKKLLQTTLTLTSFTYYDVVNNSFFNRSSAGYALTDQISLTLGYDWIHGDKGMFTMYRNNSEYWVKAKFSF